MSVGVRVAIAQLAAGQWGLVTSAQATAAGASRMMLSRMTASGELERVATGVYATPAALADPWLDKRAQWLSLDLKQTAEERLAQRHTAGVLSHATAATMHEIGDILDDRVEITLPHRRQSQRPELRLHRSQLRPDEVTSVDGLPVTTPARTIADLVVDGHDRDHVATAMKEAVRRDLTSLDEVHAALTDRVGGRAESVYAELLAAAGMDEASLQRAVLASPVTLRAITQVASRMDAILPPLVKTTAISQLLANMPAISRSAGLSPQIEKAIRDVLPKGERMASFSQRGAIGHALPSTQLQESLGKLVGQRAGLSTGALARMLEASSGIDDALDEAPDDAPDEEEDSR